MNREQAIEVARAAAKKCDMPHAESLDPAQWVIQAIIAADPVAAEKIIGLQNDLKTMFRFVETLQDRCNELRDQREQLLAQLEKAAKVDMFHGVIDMLRLQAHEPGAAKNYVELSFKWDRAIAPGLPFRHVSVVFRRDGHKSPGELVREALQARDQLAGMARDLSNNLLEAGPHRTQVVGEIERLASTPSTNPLDGSLDIKE